ncbi:MAG: hypothetical protein WC796_04225 [Candidatus Pacearchaeota archaeon]|jgi:hypothetical protein
MRDSKYQSRVVRERAELWVPHGDEEIAFVSHSFGPNNYPNVGNAILAKGLKVPTGDYTASLLYTAYCDDSAVSEPEFVEVRNKMKKNCLWVFNTNLWARNGVYVLQDEVATGRDKILKAKDLEEMLKGGRELSSGGVRVSNDGRVRFAPKGSYVLGSNTPEAFAKDGFIIASCGQAGAEKLGEVTAKFKTDPEIQGFDIEEGRTPKQRVSAVDEYHGRFNFIGQGWFGGNDINHAFAVLRAAEGSKAA